MMLNFHLVTIFPEFFLSPLRASLVGRARKNGVLSFSLHNPRDFSQNRHRHVDDKAYGGGPGMVMEAGPVAKALKSIPKTGRILLMSPSGRPFDQDLARQLARNEDITLVCGRYEGIDSRLGETFPLEEVSLCQAVLNGGETAALAVIEAVSRMVPGFLGKDESASDESFANGLLEYPQYTRPETFEGRMVPRILLSGNHARIAAWRRAQSLAKTLRQRPDLLALAPLNRQDAEILAEIPRLRPGRNLSFCLFHYPVYLENKSIGASSLTNLDIHDIARISRSYGMGSFYVLTPLKDQLDLLRDILKHWLSGPAAARNADRSRALQLVRPVASIAEMEDHIEREKGCRPVYLASSAIWPKGKEPALTPRAALELCVQGPVVVCLGTARGLALEALDICSGQLRPLRFLDENHLSVRGAAAILADRILGDFN